MTFVEEKKEEEMILDRDIKLQIVLDKIAQNCSMDSAHEDLRKVHTALQMGDKLQGKTLSGGYTNYSYKITLENDPGFALFAKIGFAYALWCPGEEKKHYDLDRQKCEFELMERFSKEMGGPSKAPVATPYLLIDVGTDMRILVTQWAPADEQFANQFIEGVVDRRVLPKLAKALATINLADCDPDINSSMKAGLREIMETLDETDELFNPSGSRASDACMSYLSSVGKARFGAIDQGFREADERKDCLVHSDTHAFNILVEGKPDTDNLQQFGEFGSVFICDWEMAHVSTKGRDMGLLFSFPIACAYFHAAQGNLDKADNMVDSMREVWDHYAAYMEEGGKDQAYLKEAYRTALGFTGFVMFTIFYRNGALIEHVNTDGLTSDEVANIKAAIGVTGIKLQEAAFMEDVEQKDYSLDQLRAWFDDIVTHDIASMSAMVVRRHMNRSTKQRASMLRASGRRVSDAGMYEISLQRLSMTDSEGGDF